MRPPAAPRSRHRPAGPAGSNPAIQQFIASNDHPATRRAIQQFVKIRIDFGMVAQPESQPGLFGPGAAGAADNVE